MANGTRTSAGPACAPRSCIAVVGFQCDRTFRDRGQNVPGPDSRMSIELRKVSKAFGEVPAVNQVSFAVKEGELLGLLGPSGGGKTTVLRMIAGLELPTDGDILIRGVRVNDVSVQKRN